MQREISTIESPARLTVPRFIAAIYKTSPLWRVEVQIISTAYCHQWLGYAGDSSDATDQAMKAAGRDWPGFPRCVRSVVQVSA